MARYLYKKYSLAECWSGSSANNLGTATIFSPPIDVDINQWIPISGTMYFKNPFRKNYRYLSNPTYPACGGGFYHNYIGMDIYGDEAKAGDVGYALEGFTVYKGTVLKVGTPGVNNSYSLQVNGHLSYQSQMQNFTIYKHHTQGSFIEDIIAEDGTYPNNGKQDGFWYVRTTRLFPTFHMKVDGVLKESDNGWVKVDGQLKEIDKIWIKVDGILKEI